MSELGLRIIKMGGSLIEYPPLPGALIAWLRRQPPMKNVIVTGGGVWADEVRRLAATRPVPDEAAHWLAVKAMKFTAWLLHQMLPQTTLTDRLDPLIDRRTQSAERIMPVIFDAEPFLRHVEPQLPVIPLPIGWHVTSDSIAARLAEVTVADEFVLLKSTGPPGSTLEQASRDGAVDAYFPRAVAPLPVVRWVNLRHPHGTTVCWRPRSAESRAGPTESRIDEAGCRSQ